MKGKFFIFLFGYMVYAFSFLVPRSKQKWAFGSFRNAFNDNAKYLFIGLSESMPHIQKVWISADKKTVQHVRNLGLKAEFIGSFKGLWFALRAKHWFYNSYSSDILFFASGGATCINLWHGVGLNKKIEFSITEGELAKRFVQKTLKERFFHPENFRRPDYMLSSTPLQSAMFAEAFRIPIHKLLNIGYPRNTILLANEEERQEFINKYENPKVIALINKLKTYDKVFIYMPTWRDSQRNLFSESMDLNILNNIMKEKNSLMLLKPHANTLVDSEKYKAFENILFADKNMDIYPVLPYTDVLITDYSSILYDFILMPQKELVLYVYDYDEYANQRDFYPEFLHYIPGKICSSFTELQECLQESNYALNEEKREEVIAQFWGMDWNKTLSEISIEIITKTF
ncbi:MAG: CDP-glycerol glycerophosphotransferase family protein [Lentimicrobiaceae bacterium]|nr:CDP-glycerol glycerophosphotransferase family protein [Lentimicrobiaceae bacterium]